MNLVGGGNNHWSVPIKNYMRNWVVDKFGFVESRTTIRVNQELYEKLDSCKFELSGGKQSSEYIMNYIRSWIVKKFEFVSKEN